MGEHVRVVSIPGGGGAETDYWETMWAAEKLEVPTALARPLEREVAGHDRVLEAGCGQGSVVQHLRRPDRFVVGVDLATRSLAAAHTADPTLALATADVERLPFPDDTFDAVLSLGVVEHLETGPVPALVEHGRVLAPDGVLILTVPHRSWLRACTDWWQFSVRRRTSYIQGGRIVSRRATMDLGPEGSFHQYELSPRHVRRLVTDAGLRVLRWEPLDVGRGLRDLRGGTSKETGPDAPEPPGTPRRSGLRGLVRHLTTGADPAGPIARATRRTSARALGHIQLVVATRP